MFEDLGVQCLLQKIFEVDHATILTSLKRMVLQWQADKSPFDSKLLKNFLEYSIVHDEKVEQFKGAVMY